MNVGHGKSGELGAIYVIRKEKQKCEHTGVHCPRAQERVSMWYEHAVGGAGVERRVMSPVWQRAGAWWWEE